MLLSGEIAVITINNPHKSLTIAGYVPFFPIRPDIIPQIIAALTIEIIYFCILNTIMPLS